MRSIGCFKNAALSYNVLRVGYDLFTESIQAINLTVEFNVSLLSSFSLFTKRPIIEVVLLPMKFWVIKKLINY
ncbi:MAG: hypothetical protein ACJA0E_001724 [Bermanella sp.]|jgi:hypothetical protein